MPAAIVFINLSFFNDVKNAVVLCSWQVVGSEYFMQLRFALATPQQTEHSGDTYYFLRTVLEVVIIIYSRSIVAATVCSFLRCNASEQKQTNCSMIPAD